MVGNAPNDKFILHLKECKFRFDYKDKDLYKLLLKILKEIYMKKVKKRAKVI